MSIDKELRWLPFASWLFLFLWSAGYYGVNLALESTTPLNLLTLRFRAISRVTSIIFLLPGIAALIAWMVVDEVMHVEAWPDIALAVAVVLLVLYAPQNLVQQQTETL
jgi:uncharacterized membrane protein YuzA (DUF378 family)